MKGPLSKNYQTVFNNSIAIVQLRIWIFI